MLAVAKYISNLAVCGRPTNTTSMHDSSRTHHKRGTTSQGTVTHKIFGDSGVDPQESRPVKTTWEIWSAAHEVAIETGVRYV